MKTVLVLAMCILGFSTVTLAEETIVEKATVTAKDAKRAVKKGVNRTKEAMCGKMTGDSKVECLAKHAKHNVTEGADAVKDKASEVKNAVDSDKK